MRSALGAQLQCALGSCCVGCAFLWEAASGGTEREPLTQKRKQQVAFRLFAFRWTFPSSQDAVVFVTLKIVLQIALPAVL